MPGNPAAWDKQSTPEHSVVGPPLHDGILHNLLYVTLGPVPCHTLKGLL